MNKYQYGYNNPYKFNDPNGHCPECRGGKPAIIAPIVTGAVAIVAFILSNPTPIGPRPKQTTAEAVGEVAGLIPIPGAKLAGALAGKIVGKVVSKIASTVAKKTAKVIKVSAKKYPESAKHIADAQKAGQPEVLTVNRKGATANRREALKGTKTKAGKDRDEYPPAVTSEGGKGASVRTIDRKDNRGSGASIGNQLNKVNDGDKVRIKVID